MTDETQPLMAMAWDEGADAALDALNRHIKGEPYKLINPYRGEQPMTRAPRNAYIPGQPLPTELHAIGRPVTLFIPGADLMEAGHVSRVNISEDAELSYDIRVSSGATYREVNLGTLMNPQPNTFVFAP